MNYENEIAQNDLRELINRLNNWDFLKNKTILITGANGMLATYFIYLLMYLNDKKNMNITILALSRNKKKLNSRFIKNKTRKDFIPIVQDVCEEIKIKNHIDYIIHMASSANPKNIIKDPIGIIKANLFGTFNVLELARKNDAEVIFTSTREIYGKMPNYTKKINENEMGVLNCFEGRACYPESKRMAETILISYYNQYNVKFKNLRIAHTYGPGMNIDNDGRIMSDLISNVVNNEDIVLKSKGEAKRAFCYVSDAIIAIALIMQKGKNGESYNISNETEEIAIKDLAELLAKKYRLNIKYEIQENKGEYTNFQRVGLDNEKIEKLGWKPEISLIKGIENTVNSFTKTRK